MIDNAAEIWGRAKHLLSLLVGCLDIASACNSISIVSLHRFNNDQWATFWFTEHDIRIRSAAPTNAKDFACLIDQAEAIEWFNTAVSLLGAGLDWSRVYLIIESLEREVGSEAELFGRLTNGGRIRNAKRTANTFRHLSGGRHTSPRNPLRLHEARDELISAIRQLLSPESAR